MSLAADSFGRRLANTRLRDALRGRVDGRLDWRAAIASAGLPEPLSAVVEQVGRRARLWKRERVEVVEELIAHFADGLEAGGSPDTLGAAFGDPAIAARLIRRSKLRCRPLWWQAWWWASRTTAALVAVYALMALWLAGVRPNVATDYLAILNAPAKAVPEEERAWPLYVEALKVIYDEAREDPEGPQPSSARWEPWLDAFPTEFTPEVVAWLDDHQEVVAKTRSAAARPRMGAVLGRGDAIARAFDELHGVAEPVDAAPPEDRALYSVVLPHVQANRLLARVLRADVLHQAKNGDAESALADVEALLGVARHSGEGSFLVGAIVKTAIEEHAYAAMEFVMRERPDLWSNRRLTRLAHVFATIDYDFAAFIHGERLACLDMVQRVYSDDGQGDGYLLIEAYSEQLDTWDLEPLFQFRSSPNFAPAVLRAAGPVSRFGLASRAEVVALNDELQKLAVADANTPLWERTDRVDERLEALTDGQTLAYAPIVYFTPAYSAVANAFDRALGRRDGVLLGIALELYRREQGDWPESLSALAPRWLPEVPVDRINGGPLGYRVVDGKPLVYSLGVDGDDDLGWMPSYMNDAENERLGYPTTDRYRVGRPLTPAEVAADPPGHYVGHDGDWVIWSLGEPRYVQRARGAR